MAIPSQARREISREGVETRRAAPKPRIVPGEGEGIVQTANRKRRLRPKLHPGGESRRRHRKSAGLKKPVRVRLPPPAPCFQQLTGGEISGNQLGFPTANRATLSLPHLVPHRIPIVHGGSDVSMPRGLLLNYKRGPRARATRWVCVAQRVPSPPSPVAFASPLVRMPHHIVRPGADELARQNPILVRRKLSGLSPQLEARSESPIQRADSALTDGSSLYPRFEKQSSVLPSTCNPMVARGS